MLEPIAPCLPGPGILCPICNPPDPEVFVDMSRPDWHQYFMQIATDVARRATCDRKHVGALIVREKNILATGYNGSIPGTPHCDDVGHMMIFDPQTNRHSCVRTVHAEANAIVQAAKHGNGIEGAAIYTTASPCWPCFKLIASAGIKTVVFGELYKDERLPQFAKDARIELVDLSPKPVLCSDCNHEKRRHTSEEQGCKECDCTVVYREGLSPAALEEVKKAEKQDAS